MLTPLQYSVHLQLSLNHIPMIYVDDLMAIADAVRVVAQNHDAAAAPATSAAPQSGVGRRGHLRAVPS